MSEIQDTTTFDLRKLFGVLRAHWLPFVTTLALFVGLSFALASRRAPSYRSQAQVLVASSPAEAILDSSFQNLQIRERELSNEVTLATGDAVETTMKDLFGKVPKVVVKIDVDSDVLLFNAIAEDPETAAKQANAWANAYVTLKQNQSSLSIKAATDVLSSRLEDLRTRRTKISEPLDVLNDRISLAFVLEDRLSLESEYNRLLTSLKSELDIIDAEIQATVESISGLDLSQRLAALGSTQLVRAATPAAGSSNTPTSVLVILGGIAGVLVGSGLVLILANLDHRLKTAEDVTSAVGIPVIAEVPEYKKSNQLPPVERVVSEVPSHPVTDAYLAARSALQFSHLDKRLKTVLVTSASASEGKTSTAVNLAYAFARLGKSVAIVDLDLRRPRLHQVFGHAVAPGLTDSAVHDLPLDELFHDESSSNLAVRFLATGALPASATDYLASSKFSSSIDELEAGDEIVIFDSAPVLPVPDTLVLASKVDATILVARAGVTRKRELQSAVESLVAAGAKIAGIVLVGVSTKRGYYGYETNDGAIERVDSTSLFGQPAKHDAAAAFDKLGEAQRVKQTSSGKTDVSSKKEHAKKSPSKSTRSGAQRSSRGTKRSGAQTPRKTASAPRSKNAKAPEVHRTGKPSSGVFNEQRSNGRRKTQSSANRDAENGQAKDRAPEKGDQKDQPDSGTRRKRSSQ